MPNAAPIPSSNAPTRAPGRDIQPTVADSLVEKAKQIDPTIAPQAHRLLPRIADLMVADTQKVINYGERNLVSLRTSSNENAKFANRVLAIKADQWLKETMEASTRVPGFLDRLRAPQPPSYYESMLQKARAELMDVVNDMAKLLPDLKTDERDLHCDSMALQVVYEHYTDTSLQAMAQNRLRLLLTARQSVAMLVQTIENLRLKCMEYIADIDKLLTVTIPNWKMATR